MLQPVIGPEEIPGEPATEIVEDVAALLAADDGAGGPAERVHPGLDGDPIGVLDRGVVLDAQGGLLQVIDDAVVRVPGIGIVRLRRTRELEVRSDLVTVCLYSPGFREV